MLNSGRFTITYLDINKFFYFKVKYYLLILVGSILYLIYLHLYQFFVIIMESIVNPVLEGNFYTSSKKKSFYKVKLSENYLGLLKTNGSLIKTKIVSLQDIIGCKCARRRKNVSEKCECHPKNNVFSFLENTVDENDISAYLHIYSYVLKDFIITSGQKRERFKITLRFRSFSHYEDNLKEALKWRNTVKELIEKTRWKSTLLRNIESYNETVTEKGKNT